MRRTTLTLRFAAVALAASVLSLAVPAGAAPTAALGGHDIGALMSAAEESFELSTLDAVVLLDDRSVEFDGDGTIRRTTHSVVWFGTELGLDTYADLRVPYNTATSTLEIHALRTWRDGAWWPHETELSPTAIVETTPYAIQSADDYTSMREVMLLHDGVELPCIVETAYTITERGDPALGSDGLWVIPNPDPTVLKRLSVTVPAGTDLRRTAVHGAPEPEAMRSEQHGVTHRWTAELVGRLPRPLTAGSTAHEPYVVWSTWDSWEALAGALTTAIDEAAVLSDALIDSVAAVTEARAPALARAEDVCEFLRETTRGINYRDTFWRFAPRPASRTWETAYGHRLDRAALATAMLREAGCAVATAFRTPGRTPIDHEVPALAWFSGLELMVVNEGVVLDPASCRLRRASARDLGRTVWKVGTEPATVSWPDVESAYELTLSLEPADEGWSGSATLKTSGALSAHPAATGLAGETESFMDGVASSSLGASAEELGVSSFVPSNVTAGFVLSMDAPEPDDSGRTRFVIGSPTGGVLSQLPRDVHSYVAHRDSPVLLPGPMRQSVTLVLDPGDLEVVRLPDPATVSNALGEFKLEVEERDDGTLVVSRSLSIGGGAPDDESYNGLLIAPDDWPFMRELLLEESDPRHRTIMLE